MTKATSFAKYSKSLCWVVAAIWLLLSILAFTGDSESAIINGFLWLVGAFAFAISAIFLSKRFKSTTSELGNEQPSDSDSKQETESSSEQVSQ